MQTLLDTNIQLDPHTRHARVLPVHYGFLAIKYTAVCLACRRGVAGGGVGMVAVVVTCACSARATANDDVGHVQVGGWGHFTKVNGALFTPQRQVSKASPSSYNVQPFKLWRCIQRLYTRFSIL